MFNKSGIDFPKRLYSLKEAADALNLSHSTLKSWVHTRKIPVIRLGRRTMIKDSVLELMIEGGLKALQQSDVNDRGVS